MFDEILDEAYAALEAAIKDKQGKFLDVLIDVMAKLEQVDGRVTDSAKNKRLIGAINQFIGEAIKKAGLEKPVLEFVKNFEKINEYLTALHQEVNAIEIEKSFFTPFQRIATQAVIQDMLGVDSFSVIARSVRQSMINAILSGGDLATLQRELRATFLGQNGVSALQRHYIQVSRDTIGTYNGMINQALIQKYEFDAIQYVGSLVKDSRPQCRRWVKMGSIDMKDLKNEIQWAYDNGSGMKPGTTVDNFCVLRGGYSCRHEAIPTRK